VVRIYSDLKPSKRQMSLLLQEADQGNFDVVLTLDLHRFTRSIADAVALLARLSSAGALGCFLAEGGLATYRGPSDFCPLLGTTPLGIPDRVTDRALAAVRMREGRRRRREQLL
jgi:hypothetical protein